MRQKPSGWIDARDLFATTPKSTLAQWRSDGILPEPIRVSLGRGKGSAAYYPPGTDALHARLREPRRAIRDRDELVWDLWLDPADYPVNIRRWVLKRLDRFSAVLKDPGVPEVSASLKDPNRAAATIGALPRRHPARMMLGNLKNPSALAVLFSWAADIATERDPSVSLYDPHSEVLASLLKAAGLPPEFSPAPDREINPEMVSPAYFHELMAKTEDGTAAASEEELLQVRCNCRAIAVLADAAEAVDWNAVSRALDHNAAFTALTSAEPPSYRARRTERHAKRKNQLQPRAVRMLLALWKNFDFRAFAVPTLVYFRRSPDHGKILSEIIALSHLALTQLPRRAAEPEIKPSPPKPIAELAP